MQGGSDAVIANANNFWMFDFQFQSSSNQNLILASVAPNMDCICNDQDGQIFFGDVLGTGPLQSISLPANTNVTGGIVSLHPYLFYFGTDGIIGWSVPGEPSNLTGTGSGNARVWGQKIIKGLPLRAGSGTAPGYILGIRCCNSEHVCWRFGSVPIRYCSYRNIHSQPILPD